ncbi:MAG: ATP synthase F1 subunit delta [Alphaproteobacteria bacterium]|nr:ATP synthase F1 subunit delta [Alphaproteobacteria bacterium]
MAVKSKLKSAAIYTDALYAGATESDELTKIYQQVRQLKDWRDEDWQQLYRLDNPLWPEAAKYDILKTVCRQKKFCTGLLNLMKILAQKNELNLLPLIAREFIRLYQQKHNIAEINVTTVMPLTKKQEQRLIEKLEAIFHKDIVLNYTIDSQIIGGLVLECGTYLIDASIRCKLNSLEKIMKGTQ